MRKTHWTALAAALLLGVSALAGCSKKESTLDVQKAADDLKAGVTFKDELAPRRTPRSPLCTTLRTET